MTQQLVDPDGNLVAEGGGHGVLAMGASGHRHVRRPFRQIGHGRQHLADLPEEDRVCLAQHQQVAGLGDVLRGRAPVHPAAVRFAHDAAEFPDQGDDRVAGPGESFVEAPPVHQLEPRLRGDRLGRFGRNDTQFGLRASQGGLDIEPRLPAVFQSIQGANAGVGNAGRGRQGVAAVGHQSRP